MPAACMVRNCAEVAPASGSAPTPVPVAICWTALRTLCVMRWLPRLGEKLERLNGGADGFDGDAELDAASAALQQVVDDVHTGADEIDEGIDLEIARPAAAFGVEDHLLPVGLDHSVGLVAEPGVI